MENALRVEAKVHLAYLAAFVPPTKWYSSLSAAALTALLHLMAKFMGTLPPVR